VGVVSISTCSIYLRCECVMCLRKKTKIEFPPDPAVFFTREHRATSHFLCFVQIDAKNTKTKMRHILLLESLSRHIARNLVDTYYVEISRSKAFQLSFILEITLRFHCYIATLNE
jgi:hypothetical protein